MIEIHTDASFHPVHRKGGYAYKIKQDNRIFFDYGTIPKAVNPIDAELQAIEFALRRLLKTDLQDNELILRTDCKFAIHAINTPKSKKEKTINKLWLRVQKRTKAGCRMEYVPAHSGNKYNDWCDNYAKKGMWFAVGLEGLAV